MFSIVGFARSVASEVLGRQEGEFEAEVIYGELVKVSSKRHEISIEFKEGKEWVREDIRVPEDWPIEDWEDLADHIGDEGRFFTEDGELTNYNFE